MKWEFRRTLENLLKFRSAERLRGCAEEKEELDLLKSKLEQKTRSFEQSESQFSKFFP